MPRPTRRDLLPIIASVVAALIVGGVFWLVADLARDRRQLADHVDQLSRQVRDLGGTPTPGPTGPIGRSGTPGPSGPRGPGPSAQEIRDAVAKYMTLHPPRRGRTGRPGATGPSGRPGATGAPGHDGQDGTPGQTGATGPPGPQGDRGPAGDTGPQGPQGDRGEPGPAPSTVYCQPPADPTTGPWTCTTN